LQRTFKRTRLTSQAVGGIGAAGVRASEVSRRNELRTRNALNGPRIGSYARDARRRASARRVRSHAIRARGSCRQALNGNLETGAGSTPLTDAIVRISSSNCSWSRRVQPSRLAAQIGGYLRSASARLSH